MGGMLASVSAARLTMSDFVKAPLLLLLAVAVQAGCAWPESWLDENLNECATSCHLRECGTSDGCECGECSEDEKCQNGLCLGAKEACMNFECGSVNGYICGICAVDEGCAEGQCAHCDYLCSGIECGDHEGCHCGEECPDGEECNASNRCECVPECGDGVCGDDGCGGSCGMCKYGDCIEHACVCEPDCVDKECGPDGCGGSCKGCLDETPVCYQNHCYERCDTESVQLPLNIQKVSEIRIGKGGVPGEALNIDADLDTCTPTGDCQEGLNNQLSISAESYEQFVDLNVELIELFQSEGMVAALQLPDLITEGVPFSIHFYNGLPTEEKEECDYTAELCDYVLWDNSLFPDTCEPAFSIDNVTLQENRISGGSLDSVILLPNQFTFHSEVRLMPAYFGHVEATAELVDGKLRSLSNGIMAGALRKSEVLAMIENAPEDQEFPVSNGMMANLADMFITPDLDTDGDGEADAISAGYVFSSISGTMVSLEASPFEP
jgi:hypothetical protein